MKNMSKTNKERLMEMNLQTFAAEDGLTVANDLGEVRSIDFVNLFGYSIEELLQVLGVTRRMTLTGDEKIQTYRYETTMAADNAVGEGELIPLSKVKKVKGPAYQVPLHKYRKAVSAESIRRVGSDAAINETDEKSWKKSKKLSKVNSLLTLLLIQQNKMLKDSKLHYQWDGLRQRSSLKGTCQLFQWLTRPMLQNI